ncbi:arsenical resistance operon transcriptional repressor ArsD [Cellulomonas sp. WB94]|uniref:arsenite efflux transporter metallochaperone ArsD n=1 Tax=Cellulomonas sp. WB94 TaxID=2173174 RepID=UPI000D57B6B8|nr:arsenite efflux transporter metallochaperone ArsD [Cellulomonas sp. WB94]PVU81180.1 arsenical resistance operon transcriptional repressor ArsD [Cellulomonas sp. WB94]
MATIEVFEPALCCATGVCGPDVDQRLVTFSADTDRLRSEGGDIRRVNLASEPAAFAASDAARQFLQLAGSGGLPLVLVDGVTVLTGRYPTRDELSAWAGPGAATDAPTDAPTAVPAGATLLSLVAASTSGARDDGACCGGGGCC